MLVMIGLLSAVLPLRCAAVLLDWSTLSWTPGSLSQSFDIDPNNPGNDVTITISGDTAAFVSGYPKIATTPFTGGTAADSGLQLRLNFPSNASNITVTVQFTYAGKGYAYGVDQAHLTLFDIDQAKSGGKVVYADQISSIQGAAAGTGTAVAATITNIPGSPTYTVANNGTLSATVTGNIFNSDNSGNGNVGIDFGTNDISSFSFIYGNGPGVQNNPAAQGIAGFDITYRPKVPEAGPALAAMLVCGLAVGWRAMRSIRLPPLS
ncbi:MAG: hypothetical protein ACYDH9_19895 [Limisphaerales bacterium]